MIATFLNELLTAVVQVLPRLFLVGAPFLLVTALLAAVLDAKLPGIVKRTTT